MKKHQGDTDKVQKIKLESSIEQVLWTRKYSVPGGMIGIEVFTKFVGSNAEIKIELKDKNGKSGGKLKSKMSGYKFWASFKLPEDVKDELIATVKLPKHNLEKKSSSLPLYPPIKLSNLKWDKNEAKRGDILKLTADIKGLSDGNEAEIQIWEHDADQAHDLVTKLPVIIKNQKVEAKWEFQFNGTAEEVLATASNGNDKYPQYFFTIDAKGITAKSDLISMKWVYLELIDENNNPVPKEKFFIELPDGTKHEGELDNNGRAFICEIEMKENVKVSFPNIDKEVWEKI